MRRGLGSIIHWILIAIFGEENAFVALILVAIALVLALIVLTCHEVMVYMKRAGDRASLKGFWRFHKEYPAEQRRNAQARRKEREARKEARLREKNEQKENKD